MKAASLLVAVLCFPVLLSTQQNASLDFPVPPDHPGQKMLMLNHRDLLLMQLKSYQEGRETSEDAFCTSRQEATKESCEATKVHVEAEQGSDSETILIHAYYRVNGSTMDKLIKSKADVLCLEFPLFMGKIGPKWLKWERRDNGGPVEALK